MTEHKGKIIDTINGIDVIECKTCSFKHVMPLPTTAELKAFYRHDFYEKDKPLSIPHKIEDQDWLNIQYSDRYDVFEKHIDTPNPQILDIGSGAGFFLKHGLERGWDVLGLEPSSQAANFSTEQGVQVIQDMFSDEIADSLGLFDVIHASLVLEHVPNPKSLLEAAYKITKPGGIICISTPNDYNPFQKALRDIDDYRPWWVCPTHHLNYFTPDTLETLIKQSGYTPFHSESSFPIDMFLLMGDNYIDDGDLGRACHKKRIRFESTLKKAGLNDIKRKLYKSLAELNLGREICVYAKKHP